MPTVKNGPTRNTAKRIAKPTGVGKNGIISGEGQVEQTTDLIDQRTKKAASFRLDSVFHLELKPTNKKEFLPANWLSSFASRYELPLDIVGNRLEWFKAIRMFVNIPGFIITREETLLDVVKKAFLYAKTDYKYIVMEDEMALTEVAFDCDNFSINFDLTDILRIKAVDPKLHYAIMLLVRIAVQKHGFGSAYNEGHYSCELQGVRESVEWDLRGHENDTDNLESLNMAEDSMRSYNEILWSNMYATAIYKATDLIIRRENLVEKLIKSGYYKTVGLDEVACVILDDEAVPSPYVINSFEERDYMVQSPHQRDATGMDFMDLFVFSADAGNNFREMYLESSMENFNNNGAEVYLNVFGNEANWDDSSMKELYNAFESLQSLIIQHESNKSHYNILNSEE